MTCPPCTHDCDQSDNCPARKAPAPEQQDPCSYNWAMDIVWGFLAALGVIAMAGLFGLYSAGFFRWAAKALPENAVLQLLFGGV